MTYYKCPRCGKSSVQEYLDSFVTGFRLALGTPDIVDTDLLHCNPRYLFQRD